MTTTEAVGVARTCPHCIDEYMAHISPAVATIEELAALPFESIIRDAEGHVLERWGDEDKPMWLTIGVVGLTPTDQIMLPATIIYRPTP